VREFDLHGWFDEDELDACQFCGQRAVLRVRVDGSLLCFECGYLQTPGVPVEAAEK